MTELTNHRLRELIRANEDGAMAAQDAVAQRRDTDTAAALDELLRARASLSTLAEHRRCVDCSEPTGATAVCEVCAGLRCESVLGTQAKAVQKAAVAANVSITLSGADIMAMADFIDGERDTMLTVEAGRVTLVEDDGTSQVWPLAARFTEYPEEGSLGLDDPIDPTKEALSDG